MQADVAHEVCRQVRDRVGDGMLIDGLPPLSGAVFVGIGQSLGGFITMIRQGQLWDRFYAWLAVLACLPAVAYPE